MASKCVDCECMAHGRIEFCRRPVCVCRIEFSSLSFSSFFFVQPNPFSTGLYLCSNGFCMVLGVDQAAILPCRKYMYELTKQPWPPAPKIQWTGTVIILSNRMRMSVLCSRWLKTRIIESFEWQRIHVTGNYNWVAKAMKTLTSEIEVPQCRAMNKRIEEIYLEKKEKNKNWSV